MNTPASARLVPADPATCRSGGRGMNIVLGQADSPFGRCAIGWCHQGFCWLGFPDTTVGNEADGELRRLWPEAEWARDDEVARRFAEEVFRFPPIPAEGIQVFVRATPFQAAVWRALQEIPPGQRATYGEIAARIGLPGASRAVGSACAANPVAHLIPCHRVVRADGKIDGFRWGTERKRAMLAREAENLAI